jgi:hypothetical protein
MSNALTHFLNAGLLPIGEDDEKFKLLEAAAVELSKKIAAKPLLTYRFALVGLSDQTKADDPVLLLTEVEIRSKWPTSVNKLGASPVQIYRAVVLRALELVASRSDEIKGAIALIAKNEPTLQSQGKERAVIENLIASFGQAFQNTLFEAWAKPINLQLSKLAAKIKNAPLTKESLAAAIASAVGPTDKSGKAIPNSNPHWPSSDHQWGHEFVHRATEAIFAAIQNSTKVFVDELQVSMRELLVGITTGFNQAALRDAKSELLWLRMSMYSPSGSRSYRSMSLDELLFHSISDVSSMVGPTSPPSVEHFLQELVSSITQDEIQLGKVLPDMVARISANTKIEALFHCDLAPKGRRSWLDIGLRPNGAENFANEAGVKADHTERRDEYAVKFFREIQIRKLLSGHS